MIPKIRQDLVFVVSVSFSRHLLCLLRSWGYPAHLLQQFRGPARQDLRGQAPLRACYDVGVIGAPPCHLILNLPSCTFYYHWTRQQLRYFHALSQNLRRCRSSETHSSCVKPFAQMSARQDVASTYGDLAWGSQWFSRHCCSQSSKKQK